MTWREFLLREHGWKRQFYRGWEQARFVAHSAHTSNAVNPKKIPKTPQKFLPLESDKGYQSKKIDTKTKDLFLKEVEKYNKKHKK